MKSEIRILGKTPAGARFGIRASGFPLGMLALLFSAAFVRTAGAGASQENDLSLRPPYDLLPPTFWEQYGWSAVLAGAGMLILLGVGLWLFCRPRPPVPVPPEETARRALLALRNRPEDGAVLSAASQVVRRYVSEAFQLATGELTTTEFCRLIEGHEGIGSELAAALRDYLREGDRRKFAPAETAPATGSVARAQQLLEAAHARRVLTRLATSAGPRTATAHA